MQSAISSCEYKIKQLEIQNNDFKLAREEEAKKEALKEKVDEKKIHGRMDELTDFYRHLNTVVETMIEKFSLLEKVNNKVLKQQNSTTLPPIRPGAETPTSPLFN